jgi:hypothetical protein
MGDSNDNDNVVPFKVVPKPESAGVAANKDDDGGGPQPQPDVIEFIENLLERAKAGRVQSVAVCYVTEDYHPADGWMHGDRLIDRFILPTAVSCLIARLADGLNSRGVPAT